MPQIDNTIVLLGCVGGLLPDVLRLIKNHHNPQTPPYLKTLNFWLGVVLMVLVGGFAAWILGATTLKDAVIFGYAAPELISSAVGLVQTPERTERGEVRTPPFNMIRWWAS